LHPSNLHWALYLGLHVAAVLRVGLAIVGAAPWALHAVAGLWLLLVATWAMSMLPVYWQARVDGQPG
jgi:hypothetical protein